MSSQGDSIKVAIRVRPLIEREKKSGAEASWRVINNRIQSVSVADPRCNEIYTFDRIFDITSTNKDLYDELVNPQVKSCLDGYNCTIFTYGQTSSGKTHTMDGTKSDPGIIPLVIEDLFEEITNHKNYKYLVRVAYVEIYNERIFDLLNKDTTSDVKIREDFSGNITICAKEIVTSSKKQVLELMNIGKKNRQKYETNMNQCSSRSHAIFRIIIEQSCIGDDAPIKVSHFNLVDLAGSERVAQTKATGMRLKEGGHINKSLSTLTLVISQLSGIGNFVSYRDSKLTLLLKNSLGGNAKTVIIANVTPASIEDTHSTLFFAKRAKTIKNKPVVNTITTDHTFTRQLEQQIKLLKTELSTVTEENKDLQIGHEHAHKKIHELNERIKLLQKAYVKKESLAKVELSKRRHTIAHNLPSISEQFEDIINTDVWNSHTPLVPFEEEMLKAARKKYGKQEQDTQIPFVAELTNLSCELESPDLIDSEDDTSKQDDDSLEVDVEPFENTCTTPVPSEPETVTLYSSSTPKSVLKCRLQELEEDYEVLKEFTRAEHVVLGQVTDEELRNEIINLRHSYTELNIAYSNAIKELEWFRVNAGSNVPPTEELFLEDHEPIRTLNEVNVIGKSSKDTENDDNVNVLAETQSQIEIDVRGMASLLDTTSMPAMHVLSDEVISSTDEKILALSEEKEGLEKQLIEAQIESISSKVEIDHLRKEIEKLKKADTTEDLKQLRLDYHDLTVIYKDMKKELVLKKDQLRNKDDEITLLKISNREVQQKMQAYERRIAEMEVAGANFTPSAFLQGELDLLSMQLNEKDIIINDMTVQINDLSSRLSLRSITSQGLLLPDRPRTSSVVLPTVRQPPSPRKREIGEKTMKLVYSHSVKCQTEDDYLKDWQDPVTHETVEDLRDKIGEQNTKINILQKFIISEIETKLSSAGSEEEAERERLQVYEASKSLVSKYMAKCDILKELEIREITSEELFNMALIDLKSLIKSEMHEMQIKLANELQGSLVLQNVLSQIPEEKSVPDTIRLMTDLVLKHKISSLEMEVQALEENIEYYKKQLVELNEQLTEIETCFTKTKAQKEILVSSLTANLTSQQIEETDAFIYLKMDIECMLEAQKYLKLDVEEAAMKNEKLMKDLEKAQSDKEALNNQMDSMCVHLQNAWCDIYTQNATVEELQESLHKTNMVAAEYHHKIKNFTNVTSEDLELIGAKYVEVKAKAIEYKKKYVDLQTFYVSKVDTLETDLAVANALVAQKETELTIIVMEHVALKDEYIKLKLSLEEATNEKVKATNMFNQRTKEIEDVKSTNRRLEVSIEQRIIMEENLQRDINEKIAIIHNFQKKIQKLEAAIRIENDAVQKLEQAEDKLLEMSEELTHKDEIVKKLSEERVILSNEEVQLRLQYETVLSEKQAGDAQIIELKKKLKSEEISINCYKNKLERLSSTISQSDDPTVQRGLHSITRVQSLNDLDSEENILQKGMNITGSLSNLKSPLTDFEHVYFADIRQGLTEVQSILLRRSSCDLRLVSATTDLRMTPTTSNAPVRLPSADIRTIASSDLSLSDFELAVPPNKVEDTVQSLSSEKQKLEEKVEGFKKQLKTMQTENTDASLRIKRLNSLVRSLLEIQTHLKESNKSLADKNSELIEEGKLLHANLEEKDSELSKAGDQCLLVNIKSLENQIKEKDKLIAEYIDTVKTLEENTEKITEARDKLLTKVHSSALKLKESPAITNIQKEYSSTHDDLIEFLRENGYISSNLDPAELAEKISALLEATKLGELRTEYSEEVKKDLMQYATKLETEFAEIKAKYTEAMKELRRYKVRCECDALESPSVSKRKEKKSVMQDSSRTLPCSNCETHVKRISALETRLLSATSSAQPSETLEFYKSHYNYHLNKIMELKNEIRLKGAIIDKLKEKPTNEDLKQECDKLVERVKELEEKISHDRKKYEQLKQICRLRKKQVDKQQAQLHALESEQEASGSSQGPP